MVYHINIEILHMLLNVLNENISLTYYNAQEILHHYDQILSTQRNLLKMKIHSYLQQQHDFEVNNTTLNIKHNKILKVKYHLVYFLVHLLLYLPILEILNKYHISIFLITIEEIKFLILTLFHSILLVLAVLVVLVLVALVLQLHHYYYHHHLLLYRYYYFLLHFLHFVHLFYYHYYFFFLSFHSSYYSYYYYSNSFIILLILFL
mmetsp:Transcript_13186/g.13653  ORF Transcript_13186/g.13653 Transcript_13186/m.13653 type:complete len:205 (+) Transcript_13186:308-922(+)